MVKNESMDITTVLNEEAVVSKQRGKEARCGLCGKRENRQKDGGKFVHVPRTKKQVNGAYIHEGCCACTAYHSRKGMLIDFEGELIQVTEGKAKVTDCDTYGLELETGSWLQDPLGQDRLAYLALSYGIQYEKDGSVQMEGHMPVQLNLHGLKRRLDGLQAEPDINMRCHDCGLHVHAGKQEWVDAPEKWRIIVSFKRELFSPVTEFLKENESFTKGIFGRSFDYDYANSAITDSKYCWVNTRYSGRIEYRLPHFVCGAQVVWCISMLTEWNSQPERFASGLQSAPKTAEKLVRIARKYQAGKADVQKPARNEGRTFHESLTYFAQCARE